MYHNNFFVQWQGRNFSIRNLCPLWSECLTRFAAGADFEIVDLTASDRPLAAIDNQSPTVSFVVNIHVGEPVTCVNLYTSAEKQGANS